MCDYCETVGTIDCDDYPVFRDVRDDVYPVEACEVMCSYGRAEVFLARHAIDWYMAVADVVTGQGSVISVCVCPVCGREL